MVSLSASRADQTDGEVQTGKLACMDEHHIRLQGRKPRESNKLFDLFFLPQANPHNPFNPWLKKNPEDRCLSLFIALARMVTLGMKVMVCFRFGR